MDTSETREQLPNDVRRWLALRWGAPRLESELGECKYCGKKDIEICVWRLNDDSLLKIPSCPDCSAKLEEARVKEEQAEREIEINNTRQNCIASSGMPPKFRQSTFETFKKGWQDKALEFSKAYAEKFPVDKRPFEYPSLYLWSKKCWGVGKTHMSCAIAHRIIERWTGEDNRACPRIYFISEPDLFRQIQATYSFNKDEAKVRDSEDDILRRLTHCDLLILDDVGKESRADPRFVQRTLFGLIDGRYKLQLPIILTANVDADGLKRHLEDASFDRFYEMINAESVCMDGQSYRRKK